MFWILDGGTIHRGKRAVERLQSQWSKLVVHLPAHASWLDRIEIYFSVLQREALTPADFDFSAMITDCILGFQEHYQAFAKPFDCCFTHHDLLRLKARPAQCESRLHLTL